VRLTHVQHLVTYNYGWMSMTLLVDDVLVARKSWREANEPEGQFAATTTFEFQFQLSDGDAAHPCNLVATGGFSRITRTVLTVDGRLLYDEGSQASVK
jgi:hypothetical protein